jgi:hypothetical protein
LTTASNYLLQQFRHGDGVDPVTQGHVHGTSEGVIGTVCELVLQLVAIFLVGGSDMLVPLSGEELEIFLTAASTDFWSGYLGKLDLLGTSPGISSTLAWPWASSL